MIQNILNKYFFYLYVFTLCFGVLLYNTTGFKGLDMVSGIVLIVFYVIYLIGTKNYNFNIGFLITILVFLFFLNYSFYISDNTRNAIAFDFLTQLRPYITFFIVSQMSPVFSAAQKSLLKKICFYLWLFFVPIGLYATANPSFLSTMMDQPSNYTACVTCLSVVYLYCGDFSVKDKLTSVFMLAIGLIAIHSQYYIFFLVACGLLMYFHHADVLKNNLRTGLALASIGILIIYISRLEILNYLFPVGITGKGFASLAVQASGFYSQLSEYSIQSINGLISQEWVSFSGSYYPVLAQLGVIGIIFYLSFWAYIIATSIIRFRQKGDIQPFIITLVLAIFIFIENISDSFFTSNKGYFVMMFIGILLGKPEDSDDIIANSIKAEKMKKRRTPLQIIQSSGKRLFLFNKKEQPVNEITFLTPPVPVRKKEPVIEIKETPVVMTSTTPLVNETLPNEHDVHEEKKAVIASTTVNAPSDESGFEQANQPIAISTQPSAQFVENEDEFEWDEDYGDEDGWDEDYIEEDGYEASERKEEIMFVPPVPEIVPPVQEVATPVQEIAPPVQEIATPVQEIVPLVQEVATPIQEIVPPVQEITPTQVQEIVSPVQEITPPVQEIVPPVQEFVSPVQEIVPPVQEITLPVQEIVPPVQEFVSPVQEITPPVQEIVPPVQDFVSPVQEITPPVQEMVPPVQEIALPVQEIVPPIQEFVSPVQEISPPVQELFVPPVQEITPPVQEIVPPVQTFFSPFKEEESKDFHALANNETHSNKPAAADKFKQPDETSLKKTTYFVEDDENEAFADGAFNYMI